MKLLQELINPATVSLTNTQQGCLIVIKMSATPEVAYESTNGSDQTVYARKALRTLGLVQIGGNKTALTQTGQQVLLNYNLTDETGQLTDRGTQVLDNYNKQYGDIEQSQQPEHDVNNLPDDTFQS